METNRRDFLKIAGISLLGITISPGLNVIASRKKDLNLKFSIGKNKNALIAKHWAMVIDTRLIHSDHDLKPIIDICNNIHNIPTKLENINHMVKWVWYDEFHHVFPDIGGGFVSEILEHKNFPVLCNHCEKPACVRACPTKATFKRSDGIVLMDFHRCIGCRFCMAACPFGARSFNFRDPRPFIKKQNKKFPTRMKGVVEKCNFCAERLACGEKPACVEVSNGILTFGDLRDPNSDVRKLLKNNYSIRRKQSLGTGPSIYYIV